jgi:hypothetical protein
MKNVTNKKGIYIPIEAVPLIFEVLFYVYIIGFNKGKISK